MEPSAFGLNGHKFFHGHSLHGTPSTSAESPCGSFGFVDKCMAGSFVANPLELVLGVESLSGFPTVDLRRQLCDQNVFVFHLPSDWTQEDLRREFSRCGTILCCKVVNRPDGSSKGFGFVCFDKSESAFQAVETMNGKSFEGKRLKVSFKKTPEECLHLQVQKLMEISNANQPYDRERDCTLFVFHLPSDWEDRDIYQHFRSFGTLLSAKIAKKDDNSSRGYGFVTYDNPRAAALAIANMNGVDVGQNKRLKVQLKQQASPPVPVPGCTIFLFHLPNDWTDNHLRQHFSHFGRIISASVQRDNLGNSRGYGFVSFERQQSAEHAVIGMNGFSVGHKRLKVSLKRGDQKQQSARALSYPSYVGVNDDLDLIPEGFKYWNSAFAKQATIPQSIIHAQQLPTLPTLGYPHANRYPQIPLPQWNA